MRSLHCTATSWLMIITLAAAAAWAGAARAQAPPQRDGQGRLVGASGYTLYTYDVDGRSGRSLCNGRCAAVWPPYVAAAEAKAMGDFSITLRGDGTRQWVYRAQPLYRYVGDGEPGRHDGDGINGVWHIVH